MQDFRDLDVWRRAHSLVLDIYRTTETLPKHEVFGLTIQLRRAATAIATKIAEGCGSSGAVEFGGHLKKARTTASELEYLVLLSRDLGYVGEEAHAALHERIVEVQKMLWGLMRKL